MTAIALLTDLRVAFADVLLSKESPGTHMTLPSVGYTGDLKQSLLYSPSRLKRKFFRVKGKSNGGMFLVAGTLTHIERLAQNVEFIRKGQYFKGPPPTTFNSEDAYSTVHHACLATEAEGFNQFEILGVVNGETYMRIFDENKANGPLGYYGKVTVAGSGGRDLLNWLAERGAQYATLPMADEDEFSKGLRTASALPLVLLEEDQKPRSRTLPKGVGGYYEAYQVQPTSLVPVDKVFSLIATVKGRGPDVYIELNSLYYHRYVDDYLLIVSLRGVGLKLQPNELCDLSFEQFEKFEIPPLISEQSPPNWTASRLLGEVESAPIFRLSLTRYNTGYPLTARFTETGDTRRLLHFDIRKNKISIKVDDDAFRHYLIRFPSNLPSDRRPIDVSW